MHDANVRLFILLIISIYIYIAEIFKEIKSLDSPQWWMESQEKNAIIAKFKASQDIWINYRDTFFQSAVPHAQGTHNLGNAIKACTLNMSAWRIEKINLINPDDYRLNL